MLKQGLFMCLADWRTSTLQELPHHAKVPRARVLPQDPLAFSVQLKPSLRSLLYPRIRHLNLPQMRTLPTFIFATQVGLRKELGSAYLLTPP